MRPRTGLVICSALLLAAFEGCTLVTDLDGFAGGDGGAPGESLDAESDVQTSPEDAGSDALLDAAGVGDADGSADAGAYAREVLADDPVIYFRLDEPATAASFADTAGSGLVGTPSGGVSPGATGLLGSWPGAAAAFAPAGGVAAAIRLGPDPRLEPASAVSVELWYRTGSATPSTQFSLVSYGTDNVNEEPYVLYVSDGYAAFYIGSPGGGGSKSALASFTIPAQTTHHFVGTYDGTTIVLYVDGAVVASAPATGPITGYDGVNGLSFGSEFTGKYRTTGTIDEVSVYTKALSPLRVGAHYEAGR
jgi:hypothetical protein